MPQVAVDHTHHLKGTANTGTADIGERPRVVLLLPLDQAEGRPPAPVRVADRVPQVAVDHTHHLKGTANQGRSDGAIDTPHLHVDPAAAVANPEKARLAPASAPLILRNPALLGVIVPDDRDAMAADYISRSRRIVGVHPARVVVVKVFVHGEACGHRAD